MSAEEGGLSSETADPEKSFGAKQEPSVKHGPEVELNTPDKVGHDPGVELNTPAKVGHVPGVELSTPAKEEHDPGEVLSAQGARAGRAEDAEGLGRSVDRKRCGGGRCWTGVHVWGRV